MRASRTVPSPVWAGARPASQPWPGPLRRKPRGRRRRVVGTLDAPAALMLERAPGRPLAAKPDLVSLLRCRWPPGAAFAPAWAARVAAGVAAALAHLHGLGVRPAR